MTNRTRLWNVIRHRPVDRVPIAPFIHVNFVQAFFQDKTVDLISKTIEVYEHFGFDIIHRNCTPARNLIGPSGPNWRVETTTEQHVDNERTTTVVHTPAGTLQEVQQINHVSKYDTEVSAVEYLIKTEQDFDIMAKYQPPQTLLDVTPIRAARQALGDKGLTAPWLQGAFNEVAYYYRRLDNLLLDPIDKPEFYHRMMEYFLSRNLQLVDQYIEAGTDMLSVAGNIASGKVVGAAYFREHILPYEKRLIEHAQGRGVPVIYHNCGRARGLFSCYRELGMDVYESLTAEPYGDTVLEEALTALAPDIVLHGGIDQIDFLMKANPRQVRERARSVLETTKNQGSFILGTSDYLHELTPHENIAALSAALSES